MAITRRSALLALIAAIAVALRLVWLDYPDKHIFDEAHYVPSARHFAGSIEHPGMGAWDKHEIVGKCPDRNFYHPPLGKFIYASGIMAFGDSRASMRVIAVGLGLLSLVVFYVISRELFEEQRYALGSTAAYSFSYLHLVHSRAAMLESIILLFMEVAVLAALKLRASEKLNVRWALIAALALAVVMSTKYSNMFVCFVFAASIFFFSKLPKKVSFGILVALAVTTILAMLSWSLWYMSHGYTFSEWIELRRISIEKLSTPMKFHRYGSSPIEWLVNHRPIWYFFDKAGPDTLFGIIGFMNPIILFSALGAIPILLWQLIKKKRFEDFVPLVWFALMYLPLIYILRNRQGFIYYMTLAIPAMVLMGTRAAYYLEQLRFGRKSLSIYVTLCAVALLLALPVLIGLPFNHWYYYKLILLAPP